VKIIGVVWELKKNNRQFYWEMLERIIGIFSITIGAGYFVMSACSLFSIESLYDLSSSCFMLQQFQETFNSPLVFPKKFREM